MKNRFLLLRGWFKTLGIQTRSLVFFLSAEIVLSGLLVWRAASQQKAMVYDQLEKRGTLLIHQLAEAAAVPLSENNSKALQKLIRRTLAREDVLYCVMTDERTNAAYGKSTVEDHVFNGRPPGEELETLVSDGAMHAARAVYFPGFGRNAPAGASRLGSIRLGLSTRRGERLVRQFIWQSAAGTIGLMILGGLFLFWLFRRGILVPLGKLVDVTRNVSRGDLDQQIESIGSAKEFVLLASSFNRMITSLSEAKDKLLRTNQDLERRVGDRTKALEKMNHELLKANVRLKELIDLKSNFVSMVSHELRTPISAIKGFTLTLERYDARLSAKDKSHYLSIIRHESDRLSRLIEELLDISRLQEGRVQVTLQLVDVQALAQSVIERYRLKTTAVAFDLKSETTPAMAWIDPQRLEQILVNLFDNAMRFSPSTGIILVRIAYKDNWTVIDVLDEGPGIPEDQVEKIFEPFYRVENEVNTRNPGTGLGLPISRSLAEAMGGYLGVENRQPRGACFTLAVPRSKAEGVSR